MLAERKKVKEARETGRQEKVGPKERDGPREIGQILVTRGTILGTIPIGTAKLMVLRSIRGRLLNLFPYLCAVSLNSSCEDFSEPERMPRGTHTKNFSVWESKGFCSCEQIFEFDTRTRTGTERTF